jgi:hypothetical protein
MQLIFERKVAEELKDKYTIVELENIHANGQMLEVFCVLSQQSMVWEMQNIEGSLKLHEQLVDAIRIDNAEFCLALIPELKGKFGGELDSFYEIIETRCKETGSTKLVLASN